jgi:hypothetical protein
LGEVKTDVASLDVRTVRGGEGILGTLNVLKLDVTESFGPSGFTVGGQANALDTVLIEELPDGVFRNTEAQVADKEGGAGRAGLVIEGLGPVLASFILVRCGAPVDVNRTPVDLGAVHEEGLLDCLGGREANVSESSRLSGFTISLHMSRLDLTARGELLGEAVVVNGP